jgi:hypothetical protein
MKRYHFSIAGEAGQLGLVGALFAETDHEAIAMLDEVLALCEGATVVDNYRGQEPDACDVAEAKISYVNVSTNGLRASMAMFDEIEGDDDVAEDTAEAPASGALTVVSRPAAIVAVADEAPRRVWNMDTIAKLVRERFDNAYVEMTGGGCATIYAGPVVVDAAGDNRYALIAGPGSYGGRGFGRDEDSVASYDFCYGNDDDGETTPIFVAETESEETIAALFLAFLDAKDGKRYAFIERAPTGEHITREWELIVAGQPTEWTMYEIDPASNLHAKGPFGFIDGNREPQFPTLEAAQEALAGNWEAANGQSID